MIIQEVIGKVTDSQFSGLNVDPVYLKSEEMSKGHQKVRSDAGSVLMVSLPKGVVLEEGDVLWSDESTVVTVKAAEEDIISISDGSKMDWAAAAYILGNLHKPVRFSADAVRTPYTRESEKALDEADIVYQRIMTRLLGRRIRAVGAK